MEIEGEEEDELLSERRRRHKNICYVIAWIFVVVSSFSMIMVFANPQFFNSLYSTTTDEKILSRTMGVISGLCLFGGIVLLVALYRDSNTIVLCWLLPKIFAWKINLLAGLVSLIVHTTNETCVTKTFIRAITLVLIQAVWFIFIAIVWNYWRSVATVTDIPTFIEYYKSKREPVNKDYDEETPETSSREHHHTILTVKWKKQSQALFFGGSRNSSKLSDISK